MLSFEWKETKSVLKSTIFINSGGDLRGKQGAREARVSQVFPEHDSLDLMDIV